MKNQLLWVGYFLGVMWTVMVWDVWAEHPSEKTGTKIFSYELPEVLSRLEQHHPELVLLRKKLVGWKRAARGAGAWPNPSISYMREQLFPLQSQDNVGVQFVFPLGGSPGRQAGVVWAEVKVLQRSLELMRIRIGFRWLRAYYSLHNERQQWLLAGEMLGHLRRLGGIVQARAKAGRLAPVEWLQWDLETTQRQIRWEADRAIWQQKGMELAKQLGLWDGVLVPQGSLTPERQDIWIQSQMAKLAQAPQILYIKAQQELAQAQMGLAHAKAWPDLQVSLGYMYQNNTTSTPAESHGFYAGISLPLPLWDRNQHAVAKASAFKRLAVVREQWLLRNMRWEIRTLFRRWLDAHQRWEHYRKQVSRRLPDLLRAADAAFLGGGRVENYLQAYRSVESFRRSELLLQREMRMLSLQLYERLGVFPKK